MSPETLGINGIKRNAKGFDELRVERTPFIPVPAGVGRDGCHVPSGVFHNGEVISLNRLNVYLSIT